MRNAAATSEGRIEAREATAYNLTQPFVLCSRSVIGRRGFHTIHIGRRARIVPNPSPTPEMRRDGDQGTVGRGGFSVPEIWAVVERLTTVGKAQFATLDSYSVGPRSLCNGCLR